MSTNQEAAKSLREISDLLESQKANPFRVNAYRRAANTVGSLRVPVRDIVEQEGIAGLTALHGVGEGIARSIYEFVATGRMSRLETLRGEQDPVALFMQIPGVGPALAGRICDHLHINTLEALEAAAHNGSLQTLSGLGKGRVESIAAWLASVLGKRRLRPAMGGSEEAPSVANLLEVDDLYRRRAETDELPKIIPKRFNPEGRAWLPLMHITRGEWHFTVLYSNTQRAHELGRTRDWVVVYFYDEHHHEGQCTVVTETKGDLIGQRVVRGREAESREHYAAEKRR